MQNKSVETKHNRRNCIITFNQKFKYNEITIYHYIHYIHYTIMFKTMDKVLKGLYSDMQRAHAECNLKQLDPPVQLAVNSLRLLPLPADMRQQLLSAKQSMAMDYFPAEIQDYILNEPSVAVTYCTLSCLIHPSTN